MSNPTEATDPTVNANELEALENLAIQKIMGWIEATETLVVEQAPPMAEELLAWGYFHSAAVMVVCAAVLIISAAVARKGHKGLKETDRFDDQYLLMAVSGTVIALASTLFFMINLFQLLKVAAAPRLYILQELARLAN